MTAPRLRQAAWFVGLYAVSVAVIFMVAGVIHWLVRP
jgi:hypothetical protein